VTADSITAAIQEQQQQAAVVDPLAVAAAVAPAAVEGAEEEDEDELEEAGEYDEDEFEDEDEYEDEFEDEYELLDEGEEGEEGEEEEGAAVPRPPPSGPDLLASEDLRELKGWQVMDRCARSATHNCSLLAQTIGCAAGAVHAAAVLKAKALAAVQAQCAHAR
jgi:hypothetical protein